MTDTTTAIDVADLSISFGDSTVVDGLDLRVGRGEFVCLLGPSGCGKSTMLRVFGDLLSAGGSIEVLGESPNDVYDRLAYVFQSPRLLRWQDALDNVVLAMKLRRMKGKKRELRCRAQPYLELVGLSQLSHRAAHVLSGGEQQRVAIARALAVEPEILLMDEPFSALDIKTRSQLRREIVSIWEKTGLTIVFVTHDVDEALIVGSRVVILSDKPTHILADVAIDLPQPRDPMNEAFLAHRDEVVRHLGGKSRLD